MERPAQGCHALWHPVLFGIGILLLPGATPVSAAIVRTESGSPPLKWNFDTYLADFFPDQNPSTRAVRYHLGTTVSTRGIQADEWNAVRAAFAQWQSVPGSKIRFEEGASVPSPTNVSSLDGRNDVVWLSSGTYGQGEFGERIAFGSGIIALTVLALDADFDGNSTGTIIEADTLINRGLDYLTDFESASSSRVFLESAMLHEIGHWLGMNHSPLGAATMWWYQSGGVVAGAGLSSDELSFARSMYGLPASLGADGVLQGTVLMGGAPVLGALVAAQRPDGIVVAGTATGSDGRFRLPGLPPGPYRLRVYPADPNTGGDSSLVRGAELDVSAARQYLGARTGFLPTLDAEVSVGAGASVERSITVTAGNPAFRIVEIRTGFEASGRASGDQPLLLRQGGSNLWVGVFVPGTVPSGATLRITGPGLGFGDTQIVPGALRQLTLVQVPVTVAPDAPAGLRSIELTAGGFTGAAVGFVDIDLAEPDYNFDGLDDRFQRRFFAPWTRSESGPEKDPDGDGFVNRREKAMGSNPVDAASVAYRLTRVRMTPAGTTITWESAPGKKYQVWSREALSQPWVKVGGAVTAPGENTDFADPRPAVDTRFYRVSDAP